jgi:hypothetical protein
MGSELTGLNLKDLLSERAGLKTQAFVADSVALLVFAMPVLVDLPEYSEEGLG